MPAALLRHVLPAAAPAAGNDRVPAGHAPARVLDVFVVEDNPIVLESLVAALEELAPVRVVGSAADERTAIEWLAGVGRVGQRCDLVIIDVFLRSGSGLGVIAAARRQRPQAPVVALSDDATVGMRARCLAGGADHVFDKSRDIDPLVAYCRALAARAPGEWPH